MKTQRHENQNDSRDPKNLRGEDRATRTRHAPGFIARLFAAAIIAASLTSCTSDDPVGPGDDNAPPPVLPAPERLNFDLDFFGDASKAQADATADKDAATKLNYFNARIRVAIIQVVAEFVLGPPVGAFALALHTVPSHQADGSYLWVYTYVDGADEAQIRLRGMPLDHERVAWELRISSNEEQPPIVNELWFEGETWRDGDAGFFRFHDFNQPGEPVVARIDWDSTANGEQLVFTDLGENPGDTLSFIVDDARRSIEFYDASETLTWFIRWNELDGTGSLRAPDYNNGQEACWDNRQNDVACSPAS